MKIKTYVICLFLLLVGLVGEAGANEIKWPLGVTVNQSGEITVSDAIKEKCRSGQLFPSYNYELKAYVFADEINDNDRFVFGCVSSLTGELDYIGRYAILKKDHQNINFRMERGDPQFIQLEDNITLHAVDPVYYNVNRKLILLRPPERRPPQLSEDFQWVGGLAEEIPM